MILGFTLSPLKLSQTGDHGVAHTRHLRLSPRMCQGNDGAGPALRPPVLSLGPGDRVKGPSLRQAAGHVACSGRAGGGISTSCQGLG